MVFPLTPLPVTVELLIDGEWTDVTGEPVYGGDRAEIAITRGRSAQAGQAEPGRCELELNNRLSKFNPHNPTGPHFGKIGRNTPVRVQAGEDTGVTVDATSTGAAGTGTLSWTHTPAGTSRGVLVLVVQTVGETEEVTEVSYGGVPMAPVPGSPAVWGVGGVGEPGAVYGFFLGSHIPPGAQPVIVSVDGTGSAKRAVSVTVGCDYDTVIDATVSFFGITTQLERSVTTTAKTVLVAALHSGLDDPADLAPATGSTEIVEHDFGLQLAGAVHKTSSTPGTNTIGWTTAVADEALILAVAVKAARERFTGEIVAWPQRWDLTGRDVWVPVEAAGVVRRHGRGAPPVASAPRRYNPTTTPTANWPAADGPATSAAAPAVGGSPLRPSSPAGLEPGRGGLAPWLSPVVAVPPRGSGQSNPALSGRVAMPDVSGAGNPEWAVDLVFRGETATGSLSLDLTGSGDGVAGAERLDWTVDNTATPANRQLRVVLTTTPGSSATVGTTAALDALGDTAMHHLRLQVAQNGTAVDVDLYVDGVSVLSTSQPSTTNQTIARLAARLTGFPSDAAFGHLAVWSRWPAAAAGFIPAVGDVVDAVFGHPGEPAGRRVQRLCREEDVAFTAAGDLDVTAGMGPQYPDRLLAILRECEATDLGVLYEPRAVLGLAYRPRASLYNQAAALSLDYTSGVFGGVPEPVDDDQATRNDVTVARRDGSQHRETLDTGPLSVQAPPAGVGVYDETVAVNVAGDGFLPHQAGWRLHLGTADEARFPVLPLRLAHPGFTAALAAAARRADVGDRVVVASPPAWLPPDDITQLAQGFAERLGNYRHDIIIIGTPESPWRVLSYESAAGSTVNKWDSGGSTLAAGVNSTATSLSVAMATGHPLWTTAAAQMGFDVEVGGERMTVSAVSGASSPQTFTVTRSVNGVVKSHLAGATVRLWQTPRWAL